jgi:hypothetical protein
LADDAGSHRVRIRNELCERNARGFARLFPEGGALQSDGVKNQSPEIQLIKSRRRKRSAV